MNILYVVNVDIENPAFGNAQRSRLVYDALCKIGKVHVLDTRNLKVRSQSGIKRVVNAIWQRVAINLCGNCLVPIYPFPLRWSTEELFPDVKFDVVVARYLYSVGPMELWKVSRRLYVDIDDFPMQVFETVYASKYGFLRRIISRAINGLFCRYVIGKLAGCWIANPEQVHLVKSRCPCRSLANIPFVKALDVPKADYDRRDISDCTQYVFTVGLMSYEPNYLGIDAFLDKVWPSVNARFPAMKYKIAGKGIPQEYKCKWAKIPNVEMLGYVDDIAQLYVNCIATIVPVTCGGGTCIKTLESMAYSRICLATPFGARGLPEEVLRDGRNGVMVYDSIDSFLLAIDKIMNNNEWRLNCEKAAREYIKANYSVEMFEKTVLDMVQKNNL